MHDDFVPPTIQHYSSPTVPNGERSMTSTMQRETPARHLAGGAAGVASIIQREDEAYVHPC